MPRGECKGTVQDHAPWEASSWQDLKTLMSFGSSKITLFLQIKWGLQNASVR